ncbi:DUF2071 domain-containing protein [Mumia sp. zg.B53]|uniref:YqjF family protein n=2 Tax=unclassified Mumia TaxID=2621872 RepID=UPI001C6E2CCB|nr:DUF2071 domain-containing protein [Mumia sp. zg.B53]MBW9214883.1 DUF2071 domain-containing protein [Mumia sp. zg.B53]
MASRTAEQRVRVPALCTSWLDLTFVHWRVPPERVQAVLPPSLTVDEYDGAAWVGLTPFRMADMRPLGLPAMPGTARTSPETNLRTYVRGPDGRDGLWFLSLDIGTRVLAALLRTAVGAPYHGADLSVERRSDTVVSTGSRHGGGPSYRLEVQAGAPAEPADLEIWLTSRWRAYTRHLGQIVVTPVEHEPWPLRAAQVRRLDQDLTRAAGLGDLAEPDTVHFSDGVRNVRLGVPSLAGRA